MKKLFLIIIASVHYNVIAQDVMFTPRIETGAWLFDSKLSADTFVEGKQRTWFDFSEVMGVVQLGGTLKINQFYVDAYAQQSSTGSDDPKNETLVEDGIDSYLSQDADFDRTEYSFLIGYQFSQLSLFAGYRYQETEIEETLENPLTGTGETREPDTWDINIDSRGPFLGAKYLVPIDFNSSFVLSGTIGYFEHDYENAYTQVFGSGPLSEQKQLFYFENDDVIELGLGLTYIRKLNHKLDLKVSGQLNYYTFDENIDLKTPENDGLNDGLISAGAIDFEADELNFQLRVGLDYHF